MYRFLSIAQSRLSKICCTHGNICWPDQQIFPSPLAETLVNRRVRTAHSIPKAFLLRNIPTLCLFAFDFFDLLNQCPESFFRSEHLFPQRDCSRLRAFLNEEMALCGSNQGQFLPEESTIPQLFKFRRKVLPRSQICWTNHNARVTHFQGDREARDA